MTGRVGALRERLRAMSDASRAEGGAHVLACLKAVVSGGPLPREEPENWTAAARAHDVLPLIASLYARHGRALPGEAQTARREALVAELTACGDLHRVATALDGIGIRWVLMKGPILSQRFYNVLGLVRGFSDLDILVHPRDFADVLDVLDRSGANAWDRDWTLMRRRGRGEMSWILQDGTRLDLHWDLVNLPGQRRRLQFDAGGMLTRRQSTVLEGSVAVPALEDLDMIVHLAVHACLAGGHRLRWVMDIQRVLSQLAPDPQELAARAQAHGAELPTAVLIQHAATWLDPELEPYAMALAGPRVWQRWAKTWSRRHPPSAWEGGRGSGQWLFQSTRDTSMASAAAGLRQGIDALAYRARSAVVSGPRVDGALLLNRPRGGPAARAAYLSFIQRHS